jgi:hypothetical protein
MLGLSTCRYTSFDWSNPQVSPRRLKLQTTQHGLIDARPWTRMSMNEGSSLKAYRSYEYYLKIPFTFRYSDEGSISGPLLAMTGLTSLHYTAIFPFYSHTDDVLKYAKGMPALELSVQLVPSLHSNIFSDPARTEKVNLEDCWMEVYTGYSLIVHAVVEMGENGN